MEKKHMIPWSTIGYLTFKRTYSREIDKATKRTEEFEDTVERVIEACRNQLQVGFTRAEENRLRDYLLDLKGSVAGRFWWQLGTETVNRLGLLSLQNCAFTLVDHPIRPFTWAFDALMLGSGVGYNIQREYVYKLPAVRDQFVAPTRVDDKQADFIVPDTREGWVRLLHFTLTSAFYEVDGAGMQPGFSYSTQLIRGKGAKIEGFGGVASGPEDLVRGIEQISAVLESRRGKQLRPIDCLDIMNIIGSVVVAGNVRRSAQIAIGDADDLQFLTAKNWGRGPIPNWRRMSNNSVVCNDIKNLPKEFWETYTGQSEPYGLINLKLSQSVGRLGDTRFKDKGCRGYNPCAEQSLWDKETCCLAEVFLPNVKSYKELVELTKLLYRICKHSLRLPCHHKETEAIVHQNMRMGIGVTGYLQATDEQREWLSEAYQELREYDVAYSKERGWPISIKLTTCKPSGTLSLMPGVTPGIHPGYAQYMIRRIRVSSDHVLVQVCKDHGYPVEFQRNLDGSMDHSTVIVEFPFSYPEGTTLAKDLTAIQQLEWVKKMQTDWSDNSVSCTVYYRPEELDEIQSYLAKNFNKGFKSLSFLRHEGHGFDQAPFEEITKEEYDRRVASSRLITSIESVGEFEAADDCASGACPIR